MAWLVAASLVAMLSGFSGALLSLSLNPFS